MGKLAVYRYAYSLSVLFTVVVFALSAFSMISGQKDPEENMFAVYISLGKPVLVGLNALLLVYWLFRLRYWLWIPVAGLAVSYGYISSMYQFYNSTKYGNENQLKILTYNVHSFGGEITGYSAKEFASMLKDKEVDVVCFQEYSGNGDFTNKDLKELYSTILPYSYIPEKGGLAIYSRYAIKQSQTIEFPSTNNGAIWVDLDFKGTTLRIINVHMQTTSFDRMRSKAAQAQEANNPDLATNIYTNYTDNMEVNIIKRAQQAKMVATLVNDTDLPLLLCGDFNDTPGTYTYETLKGKLKDGFQSAGEGYAATFHGLHNLLRIDYIFHSPSLTGLKYETIPYEMSDHNPVCMEVCF